MMNAAAKQSLDIFSNAESCLPPAAPLEMPRQALEDPRRPSLGMLLGRLFLRNA